MHKLNQLTLKSRNNMLFFIKEEVNIKNSEKT